MTSHAYVSGVKHNRVRVEDLIIPQNAIVAGQYMIRSDQKSSESNFGDLPHPLSI